MFNNLIIDKLFEAFPEAFINRNMEFIASGNGIFRSANSYICLKKCENEDDVRCAVLENLSRDAYCSMPFGERKNKKFHKYMLEGINKFLQTQFSDKDIEEIYIKLGNGIHHKLAFEFIYSGYNMDVLRKD